MASNVQIWDTMVPLGDPVDVQDRGKWRALPSDLLLLEANPTAARSDPSHYGRAYAFQGDAVMENRHLLAAFPARTGKMILYSKADWLKKVEVIPLELKGKPVSIKHCSIVRNTCDEVTLNVSFSARGEARTLDATVSLGHTGILAIKPAETMKGVSLVTVMEYGVVPSFLGDDLVFDPAQYPSLDRLCVPSENLLLGLLKGEASMLVMTWPRGNQSVTLSVNRETPTKAMIDSVDLDNDGKGLYVSLLEAPGIWHRETLKRNYLEKDVMSDWKPPFPAKWKTQLLEGKTKTTFVFRDSKQSIWRGAVGSYTYPVWLGGDTAVYRLGKKIPPTGESIVYFTERQGTPLSVSAPVDILEASLGRDLCDEILDVAGRVLRTHHRRGAEGIRRACTCGCTEAIEAVFKAGEEVTRKAYVAGAVGDMVYFVQRHVARLDEYQAFARDMIEYLERTGKSAGDSKPYIDSMIEIARELQDDYNRARDNMKTLAYADQLADQTNALTQAKAAGNLNACLELGKLWRGMGGAQDDVIAQSHRIVRKLCYEAGYQAAGHAGAAEMAKQIRTRCRACLRNPDGYEIWPNY
ncbi:MAG: hypothetical protein K9N55_19865 [Phycisphaerae bacterium]|nr:hypothetical protein [Phycisphaerae bacterium]